MGTFIGGTLLLVIIMIGVAAATLVARIIAFSICKLIPGAGQ